MHFRYSPVFRIECEETGFSFWAKAHSRSKMNGKKKRKGWYFSFVSTPVLCSAVLVAVSWAKLPQKLCDFRVVSLAYSMHVSQRQKTIFPYSIEAQTLLFVKYPSKLGSSSIIGSIHYVCHLYIHSRYITNTQAKEEKGLQQEFLNYRIAATNSLTKYMSPNEVV